MYSDCIEKGLLRKIPASKEKGEYSLRAARKWLEEAEKSLENGTYNSSSIASYLTIFHASRAILFIDGYREKSHYCITRYLEEHYMKKGLLEKEWIQLLDFQREQRHDTQYELNYSISQDEAKNSLNTAKKVLERMERLIKEKN